MADYGNPTGNSGMDEGSMGMSSESEDMGVLHISPDMLPHGMKLNEGDIVEFKVIGPQDKDGDWPVEYNMGEEKEGKEEEDSSWEDDFRKEMSPRTNESEAM